jgi:catechol 2,3-dioxygenase-like lactoylglutathione lyase family enzyme
MQHNHAVTGIGGIFFKARDPKALAAWYRDHLGVPVADATTYAAFAARPDGTDASGARLETVWSTMPVSTTYFAPSEASFMVNYRVADLDAMLAQLRAAGVWVDDKIDDSELGRFGWGADPEGNRFELWQPPRAGMPDA